MKWNNLKNSQISLKRILIFIVFTMLIFNIIPKEVNATEEDSKYTIHYKSGETELETQEFTNGENLKKIDEFDVTAPTGYEFAGWATSELRAEFNNIDYSDGQENVNFDKNSKEINLYAVWTAKKFNLTIDPNGGILLLPKTGNESTEKYTIKFSYGNERLFLKTGYYTISDDVNIAYPGFKKYDLNGECIPLRDGYKFINWTIKSGSGNITQKTDNSEIGTVYNYYFDGNNEGDVEIQANWEALPTITVDPNGAEMIMTGKVKTSSPQTITFYPGNEEKRTFASVGRFSINGNSQDRWFGFTKVNDLKVPYRSGYTFAGWKIIEGEGQISEETDSEGSYMYYYDCSYNGNVTIQAQWKSDEITMYTVSYNANEGKGAPLAQQKNENEALTLSSVKPTREGYTFQGWATNSEATIAEYQPGDSYTKNESMTLYAVWTKVEPEPGSNKIEIKIKANPQYIKVCPEINEIKYTIVEKNTNVENILNDFEISSEEYNLVIKDNDSKVVDNTEKLKTNQKIAVDGLDENINIFIVVKGDLNSDGNVDLKDIAKLNNYRINKEKSERLWSTTEKLAFKMLNTMEIENPDLEDINFRDIVVLNNYRIK